MKFKPYYLLLAILLCTLSWSQEYRYTRTLFPSATAITNVVYGTAPFIDGPLYTMEESTTTQNLVMDIFKPTGDTFALRPAVIMAHSGGFLTGNRNVNDMMALCDSLARKGYVTATIDYRQGFSLIDNVTLHSVRAVYRGLQDGRTAVRFLRANAATYGIDPTKIYFIGSSAGSFIGLHSIYLDTAAEIPSQTSSSTYTNATFPFTHTAPSLGGLDIGQNLTYNGKPDAVVGMWGAIQTTDLITPNNNTPVLLIHGEADTTVPFNTGSPFGYSSLPQSQGSNIINAKLDALGFTNKETYFVPGVSHEFYGTTNGTWSNGTGGNTYYPIVFNKIVQFLWKQHKPLAAYTWTPNNLSVAFTDTSTGGLAWWWDFGDGTYSNDQSPTHVYASPGDYNVKLYVENNIKSWDEITQTVTVPNLATTSFDQFSLVGFPNPTFRDVKIIGRSKNEKVTYKIADITGKVIDSALLNEEGDIDLSHYTKGIYFITLITDEGTNTFKVIKK